jgi:hypothetical protein
MAWDDTDPELDPQHAPVATDHRRAVMWGALAVALLAVAGIVFSLLSG